MTEGLLQIKKRGDIVKSALAQDITGGKFFE
jgi:hypothetical protein